MSNFLYFYFSKAGQYLGCPDLWLRHGNSCWQFVKNKMLTAHEAKLACQKSGGYLAAVNSADKQAFVSGYLPRREFHV